MSYKSDINGDNVVNVTLDQAVKFFKAIGFPLNTTGYGKNKTFVNGKNNINFTDASGTQHTICNTAAPKFFDDAHDLTYNLIDLIAAAKAVKVTNTDMAKALETAGVKNPENRNLVSWNNADVKYYNQRTDNAAKAAQEWLDTAYPNTGAYVSVVLNEDGNGYTYRVMYTDADGNSQKVSISGLGNTKGDAAQVSQTMLGYFGQGTTDGGRLNNIVNGSNSSVNSNGLTNEQQNTIAKDNAQAGIAAIDKMLSENNNTAGTAKTDYNLTDEDKQKVTVNAPAQSTYQMGNQVNASEWISELGGLLTGESFNTVEGDSLKNYGDRANTKNNLIASIADAVIKGDTTNLLEAIKADPTLVTAILQQQRAHNVNNVAAGQTAAAVRDVVTKQGTDNAAKATELYDGLISGEDTSPQAQYDKVYGNLVNALGSYTNQQLGQMIADQRSDAVEIAKLKPLADLITAAITSENAQAARQLSDSENAAAINRDQINANNAADAAESRAQSEAEAKRSADNAAALTNIINNNSDIDITDAVNTVANSGTNVDTSTGTRVTHTYEGADYLPESTYNTIANDPNIQAMLTPEAFKKYTTIKTTEQLAQDYGLDYLLNPLGEGGVMDTYASFADQGNKAAKKALNMAQRAYLSALAAGDVQTIQELTKMAKLSNGGQRNLHYASALQEQFAQQQRNRSAVNKMSTDSIKQNYQDELNRINAQDAGLNDWTKWVGDANENGNGLYTGAYLSGANQANALDYYSTITSAGMGSQTAKNDNISDANNATQQNISNLATNLTANNATNAASNTGVSATNKNTETSFKAEQALLAAQKKKLEDIINTGQF